MDFTDLYLLMRLEISVKYIQLSDMYSSACS